MNRVGVKRRGVWAVDRIVSTVRLSLVALILGVFVCAGFGGDLIGDDQGVRRYGLRNGVEVVVVAGEPGALGHADDVQLWLILDAGLMDETAGTRGVAQVCASMARHGVDGFDTDAIAEMLTTEEERARAPKRALGVQVILDHTIFTGHAPVGDTGAMERVLSYYAAVLEPGAWGADEAVFEDARAWVGERVSEAMSAEMVARQRWMGRLLGDGVLGSSLVLPELAEIDGLTIADASGFAERGYHAGRATILVVGDVSGVDLDTMIAGALGRVASRTDEVARPDAADGLGGDRMIFEQEPGWDQHQAVLVWASVIDGVECTHDGLRSYVIDRVAEELIRRRVERLGIAELGGESEIQVDRFELGGRVALMQWVIQRDGVGDQEWEESIAFLVRESERLAQHGAGREEIVQARGGLLAGWHRDAEAWRTMGTRERARDYLWLTISDRRIIGAARWDEIATGLMSEIRDEEINEAVRRLADPGSARVLVSRGGERNGAMEKEVALGELVGSIEQAEIVALDDGWMRSLGGDLLDERRSSGGPGRVTQHGGSGTWGGTLENGVRVWARNVGADDRVEMSVMVWGAMIRDGSMSEAEIDAAMLAWERPSTEERDAGWLAVYEENHGIEVRARRVVGGVRLSVECSIDTTDEALALVYTLLDRPMIDPGAFERWASRDAVAFGDSDPLDRALAELYMPGLLKGRGEAISYDSAQRGLTRLVQNAQIEIGIAGAFDPAGMLEQACGYFGMLSQRGGDVPVVISAEPNRFGNERRVRVFGDEAALVFGVRGGSMEDLETLRAIILAGMVLDEQLGDEAERLGLSRDAFDAQVGMSDALGDRWALLVSINANDAIAHEQRVREMVQQVAIDSVGMDELSRAQDRLVGSIDRYFDRPGYWSTRLSTLGAQGRTVEELWSIREGYRSVGSDQATRALREAIEQGDWFRIEIEPKNK